MVWKFTFLSDSLFWALFFEKPTFKSTFLSTFLWVQLFWVLFWVLFWEGYFFEYFFEDSKKCIYFFEYFLEWVSFFEPLKKVVLLFWVLFWALFFYFSELATFMGVSESWERENDDTSKNRQSQSADDIILWGVWKLRKR